VSMATSSGVTGNIDLFYRAAEAAAVVAVSQLSNSVHMSVM